MITIKSFDGGKFDGYLATPASGYGPGIVVIQEIFGVTSYMRSVADWYAAHGFVALCPDLFWRIERGVQLNDKGDDWKRAIDFYQKIDEAMQRTIYSADPADFPVNTAPHCAMCNFLRVCTAGKEYLRSSAS